MGWYQYVNALPIPNEDQPPGASAIMRGAAFAISTRSAFDQLSPPSEKPRRRFPSPSARTTTAATAAAAPSAAATFQTAIFRRTKGAVATSAPTASPSSAPREPDHTTHAPEAAASPQSAALDFLPREGRSASAKKSSASWAKRAPEKFGFTYGKARRPEPDHLTLSSSDTYWRETASSSYSSIASGVTAFVGALRGAS